MRTANEPKPVQASRDTKDTASTQGTGREPQANRPGWTKVVVATRSTAGPEAARLLGWRRGELRPKGPTIQAVRRWEGKARQDLWARERQAKHRAQKPVSTELARIVCEGSNVSCAWAGNRPGSLAARSVLTNRMSELFTYGSVGGAGGNPGPYPAAKAGGPCRLAIRAPWAARFAQFWR
jgi:hypothetical protein